MRYTLKPLREQVMVITGATSGIGLSTARLAVEQGAAVVLVSRNEEALQQLELEINRAGGQAMHVVADVGEDRDVRNIATAAVERFGRIDTWINNAGVSVYGRLEQVSLQDQRRLFDTNYWGIVHGSLAALEHLRARGGALINVGSVLSERAIPLQGTYCASKHAVKGFTDALRMEIEEANLPISVTLIKPSAIDTPYTLHAKNYLSMEPKNPPPVYAPRVVAEGILHCAVTPTRDLIIGGGGKAMEAGEKFAPRLLDKVMEKIMFDQQQSSNPETHSDRHSLYSPSDGELHERGNYAGHVARTSFYTKAAMHPVAAAAFFVGAAVATAAIVGEALQPKRKRSTAVIASVTRLASLLRRR